LILILGASGYVGSNIYEHLLNKKFPVLGTYCQKKVHGLVYFNLKDTPLDALNLDHIKPNYVFITLFTPSTNIDATKKNWEIAYDLNVEKIKKIIDTCFQRNIIPVYISSDAVFDGKKGAYVETDHANPLNCYGRIKYEVEKYIMSCSMPSLIIRVGKVFGLNKNDNTLISNMINDIHNKDNLFYDQKQVFTPICVHDLSCAIEKLILGKHQGIFHLKSLKATTRYALAKEICRYYNFNESKISPCDINKLGLVEPRPLMISLNDDKIRQTIDVTTHSLLHYLKFYSLN